MRKLLLLIFLQVAGPLLPSETPPSSLPETYQLKRLESTAKATIFYQQCDQLPLAHARVRLMEKNGIFNIDRAGSVKNLKFDQNTQKTILEFVLPAGEIYVVTIENIKNQTTQKIRIIMYGKAAKAETTMVEFLKKFFNLNASRNTHIAAATTAAIGSIALLASIYPRRSPLPSIPPSQTAQELERILSSTANDQEKCNQLREVAILADDPNPFAALLIRFVEIDNELRQAHRDLVLNIYGPWHRKKKKTTKFRIDTGKPLLTKKDHDDSTTDLGIVEQYGEDASKYDEPIHPLYQAFSGRLYRSKNPTPDDDRDQSAFNEIVHNMQEEIVMSLFQKRSELEQKYDDANAQMKDFTKKVKALEKKYSRSTNVTNVANLACDYNHETLEFCTIKSMAEIYVAVSKCPELWIP